MKSKLYTQMRIIFFFTLLITLNKPTILHSQSNFQNGYLDGYKIGYCYEQLIGCIPPNIGLTPSPSLNESPNSYFDGYNRGFSDGKLKSNSIASKSPYQNRSSYLPKYQPFIPPYEKYFFYINRLNNNYPPSKTNLTEAQIISEALELAKKSEQEYYSSTNRKIRENYTNLIRGFYGSLKNKDQFVLHDGKYNVYIVTNSTKLGTEFHYGGAVVKNGKIEFILFNHDFTKSEMTYVKNNTYWSQLVKSDIAQGRALNIINYILDDALVSDGWSTFRVQAIVGNSFAGEIYVAEVYFLDVLTQNSK